MKKVYDDLIIINLYFHKLKIRFFLWLKNCFKNLNEMPLDMGRTRKDGQTENCQKRSGPFQNKFISLKLPKHSLNVVTDYCLPLTLYVIYYNL